MARFKMNNYNILESEVRDDFRQRWSGWIESYHPGGGSGIGVPDIQILVDGRLIPIELKRAIKKDGKVFSDAIRPAQISWHIRFTNAGGKSYFVLGSSHCGDMERFIVDSETILRCRNVGLFVDSECKFLKVSEFSKKDELFSKNVIKIINDPFSFVTNKRKS